MEVIKEGTLTLVLGMKVSMNKKCISLGLEGVSNVQTSNYSINLWQVPLQEVMLLQLDSLGMDIRVHCAREIKTVRISFGKQVFSL